MYDSEPEYFDLNYACFSLYYVEEEIIEKLEIISDAYYQFLKKENKTDILQEYSPEKQREYLNAFLTLYEKAPYDNLDLDTVSVYSGGNGLRFIWETPNVKYWIEADYEPKETGIEKYDSTYINGNYKNLRQLMTGYQAQTNWLDEKFAEYGFGQQEQIHVIFANDTIGNLGGLYKNGTVYIYALHTLEHEYVHRIVSDECGSNWRNECLAHLFSYYPNSLDRSYFIQNQKYGVDAALESENATTEKVMQMLGHEMDWNNFDDLRYIMDYSSAEDNWYRKLMDKNGGNSPKMSFGYYLIDNYGEQKTVDALLHDTPEETFGKSWLELRDDWVAYLTENYRWVE